MASGSPSPPLPSLVTDEENTDPDTSEHTGRVRVHRTPGVYVHEIVFFSESPVDDQSLRVLSWDPVTIIDGWRRARTVTARTGKDNGVQTAQQKTPGRGFLPTTTIEDLF